MKMMREFGKRCGNRVLCTASLAILALMFVGMTPLAFAEGEGNELRSGGDVVEDTSEEALDAPIESAFALGDVTVSCAPLDDASAALALGEQADHAYLVTNEGEPAYVRLASSLVCGDLSHANDQGVSDVAEEGTSGEGGKGEVDGERIASSWCLAEDGWWYRSEPLAAGEAIEVHVLVEIPFNDAWKRALSAGASTSLEEIVNIGAVQARNMDVDLGAKHPWGTLDPKAVGETAFASDESGIEGSKAKSFARKGGDLV